MKKELVLMYREILEQKGISKSDIYANYIDMDMADFKQLFISYNHENHMDRIEAEDLFEYILDEVAPVGSKVRTNLDPGMSYENLFGHY